MLLIIRVTSFTLNNDFNTFGNSCVKIVNGLHRYALPFSVTEFPELFKIAWILLTNASR